MIFFISHSLSKLFLVCSYIFSPNLITHDEFSGIFKPTFDSGLCRYEIVYKNTTSVGENTLCFRLW